MSIEKIYNMSKGCDNIYDMKKPSFPEGDIRNDDPKLFYRGYDGREYYTIDALNAANKQYFDKYFPIIKEKPTGRRR